MELLNYEQVSKRVKKFFLALRFSSARNFSFSCEGWELPQVQSFSSSFSLRFRSYVAFPAPSKAIWMKWWMKIQSKWKKFLFYASSIIGFNQSEILLNRSRIFLLINIADAFTTLERLYGSLEQWKTSVATTTHAINHRSFSRHTSDTIN